MNLLGDCRVEQGKGSAEDGVVGRSLGVEVRELPIDQVAPQFAGQLAEAPAFQMFEYATAQQAVWGHARAAGARGSRRARAEAVARSIAHPPGAGPPVRVNRPSVRPLVSPRAYRTTRLGVGRRSSFTRYYRVRFTLSSESCDISRFLALSFFAFRNRQK